MSQPQHAEHPPTVCISCEVDQKMKCHFFICTPIFNFTAASCLSYYCNHFWPSLDIQFLSIWLAGSTVAVDGTIALLNSYRMLRVYIHTHTHTHTHEQISSYLSFNNAIQNTQLHGLLRVQEILTIAFLFHAIYRQPRVIRHEPGQKFIEKGACRQCAAHAKRTTYKIKTYWYIIFIVRFSSMA